MAYPNPMQDPDGFVARGCFDRRRTQHIDVMLPMTEITTLLLTAESRRAAAGLRAAVPGPGNRRARRPTKRTCMQLGEKIGVPIPRTVYLDSAQQLADVSLPFPYPVVVKPARSRVRTATGLVSTGVAYARRCGRARRARAQPAARGISAAAAGAHRRPGRRRSSPATTASAPWRGSRTGASARSRRPAA